MYCSDPTRAQDWASTVRTAAPRELQAPCSIDINYLVIMYRNKLHRFGPCVQHEGPGGVELRQRCPSAHTASHFDTRRKFKTCSRDSDLCNNHSSAANATLAQRCLWCFCSTISVEGWARPRIGVRQAARVATYAPDRTEIE
jgi:hypothetical protein